MDKTEAIAHDGKVESASFPGCTSPVFCMSLDKELHTPPGEQPALLRTGVRSFSALKNQGDFPARSELLSFIVVVVVLILLGFSFCIL